MQIKVWWPLLFVATIFITAVLIFPSDLRLADLLGRAGRTEEAVQRYIGLLEKHPDREDLRVDLGRLYIARGELKKAVEQIDRVGLDYFSDLATLQNLADVYSNLSEKAKTVAAYERMAALNPTDFDVRRNLADAYQWNGQNGEAHEIYADLHSRNPEDLELSDKLISLNLAAGNYEQTLHYLKEHVERDPSDLRKRELLGNLYLQNGQRQFAAVELEQVLNLEPDNTVLRQRLAELYVWLENRPRAVAHYEYLVSHNMMNSDYFDRLIKLTRNEWPETATRYFKYRLRYLPNDHLLREELYDHYLHLGMTDEAVEQMRLLVDKNPDEPSYLHDLAYLYKDVQEPELATETFERLVAAGFLTREMFEELKVAYLENKDYDSLVSLYEKARATDHYDLEKQKEHAYFLAFTERYEEAIKGYEDVVQIDPYDARSRADLAQLYRISDRDEAALAVIMDGVEKYATYDEVFLVYAAQVLEFKGKYDESLTLYQHLADLKPENQSYQRSLIQLYIARKDFKEAARRYDTLLASNPDDLGLKLGRASLYWLQDDPDRVRSLVAAIARENAGDPAIDRTIAQFYFERSFFSEAIAHVQAALRESPRDSTALRMLGLAYAWNNQPREAKEALLAYHSLYPHDYYTHYHLGILFDDENSMEAAREEFAVAEKLLDTAPKQRESRLVRANLAAYKGEVQKTKDLYRQLLEELPGDIGVVTDYAEALIILKEYSAADGILSLAMSKDPAQYRALRLQARSYFEQERYKETVAVLKLLRQRNGADLGINIDLSDAQSLAGDWRGSQQTLKEVLHAYPRYQPAEQRLIASRRSQSEALAMDYVYEEQSDNFVREVANAIWTKAASSLMNFEFLFGRERYSTQDNTLARNDYTNLEFGVNSSYNATLRTGISAKARRRSNRWRLGGHAETIWKFNSSNSLMFSGDLNQLWSDPFSAAFFDGSVNRLQSDLNLTLWRNLLVWNRLSLEKHEIDGSVKFGQARYVHAQVGYRWRSRPYFLTYYQFYNLDYDYEAGADRNIISIPGTQTVHYLGALVDQQLTRRFFYQIGASIGLNTTQNSMQYYAAAELEYTILRNLRLRSRLAYGSQNTFTGNENSRTVSFDFFYFY